MRVSQWHLARTSAFARASVWLLVLALVAVRVIWLPAHLAFEPHCPPTGGQHAHDERGHCGDGHHHEPDGDHQCHTAVEHELAMRVDRTEIDLEPAGLAAPDVAPQLRLNVLGLLNVAATFRTVPASPPPPARWGRAPPA